jgi:Protein of unknown function DUF262/Protein of unknown function (DUF1524)
MAAKAEKSFEIAPGAETVGTLLSAPNTFFVPDYQRDYSWTSEETSELWDDIEALITGKRSNHYLGAIVVISAAKRRLEIVDGQQRLASLSLLILAIINHLKSVNEGDKARAFSGLIHKVDSESGADVPKLSLNENNRLIFSSIHDGTNPKAIPDHKLRTNKQLVQAYDFFVKKIGEFFQEYQKVGLASQRLESAINDSLHLTLIRVNDAESAFLIFETLNQRGLELSVSDLIKNHLLSTLKIKTNRESVRRHWDAITRNVGEGDVTSFLRHYWLSVHGVIREREIFKIVRLNCKDGKSTLKFVKELLSASAVYGSLQSGIVESSVGLSNGRRAALLNDLEQINLCALKQCYPVLLAAFQSIPKLSPDVFRLMLVFTFRYSVIGGQATGNLERLYSDVARRIRRDAPNQIGQIESWLGKMKPSDEVFVSWFSVKTEKSSKIARYILQCLEDKGYKSTSFHTNMSTQKVNLEHVLPRNPARKSQWRVDFSSDELSEYSARLGNLALLETEKNSGVENEDFSDKRSTLSGSKFAWTRSISKATQWTSAEIEARQMKMAARAKIIWAY